MNRMIKRGLCAALLAVGFVGCDNPEPGGVKVEAPGVDVNTGPGGARVDTPRVDVEADRGGVKVDTPGTDVKVDSGGGVDIKAPGDTK
jgi:hypothetical protein